MNWNVDQIIADFGGVNDLHAKLAADGYDLSLRAVKQWQRRNRIASEWLLILLTMRDTRLPEGWAIEDIF